MGLDLGELELRVVGVHLLNLLPGGGAQHLGEEGEEEEEEEEEQ